LAQSVEEKIQHALAPLESLLETDPSGKAAQNHLAGARVSNRIILQYFHALGGPLHEYSPDREERVKEVARWLAPYEDTLIKMYQEFLSVPYKPANYPSSMMNATIPPATAADNNLEGTI